MFNGKLLQNKTVSIETLIERIKTLKFGRKVFESGDESKLLAFFPNARTNKTENSDAAIIVKIFPTKSLFPSAQASFEI